MSDELPAWAIDVVIALLDHADTHPQFYAEYYPSYVMRRAHTCGCEPMDHVPTDVLKAVRAIQRDRQRRDVPVT